MRLRRWLPSTGVAVVLLVGVIVAAVAVARAAQLERHDQLTTSAAIEAERLALALERDVIEIERLASTTATPAQFRRAAVPRFEAVPELAAAAVARRRGARLVVETAVPNDVAPLSQGEDLASDHELDIVVARAVFEADATAGAPFDLDGRRVIAVTAPIFGGATTNEIDRRSLVVGIVIGAVDADTLIGTRWPGAVQLVAPDGRWVGVENDADLLAQPIDIRGRSWMVRFDSPREGWPASAWLVLGVGSFLAIVLASLFERELVRRRFAEQQAASRSLQLERIADAGARLQQSLDLGELLPAFAVALAEDFELHAVSIALLDSDGVLTEAFATGDHPTGAAPGDRTASIDLPLRRGWRAVGVLAVRPGRPLDGAELTSLQALADLLAVAMSNAQLYEREQLNAARLRDLDALKNAFLGTVSHELRTSMTAIMGFGELLADAWDNLDDDRRREMANRIRRSAGSLRHLVDDLLDFARLEQERLRVSPRTIDLAGVVRVTIEGLSPLLNHHELALDLPDSLPAWADPVAVERILANLVSNAAKYAPRDTTVTISASAVGDRARLVVADQGPGIPEEERSRIFARFYRLDTPESVRTRGAGIGLAILHDFAQRSNATVEVDDAPGGGARFTVDFPTAAADAQLVEAT